MQCAALRAARFFQSTPIITLDAGVTVLIVPGRTLRALIFIGVILPWPL
jgi:hypothetical protein